MSSHGLNVNTDTYDSIVKQIFTTRAHSTGEGYVSVLPVNLSTGWGGSLSHDTLGSYPMLQWERVHPFPPGGTSHEGPGWVRMEGPHRKICQEESARKDGPPQPGPVNIRERTYSTTKEEGRGIKKKIDHQ